METVTITLYRHKNDGILSHASILGVGTLTPTEVLAFKVPAGVETPGTESTAPSCEEFGVPSFVETQREVYFSREAYDTYSKWLNGVEQHLLEASST
jgi:hypothetical protein